MTVLVSGGSGFIGSYLLQELTKDGTDVCNIDVREPTSQNGGFRQVDVTDLAAVRSVFELVKPTAVVHLAARTDTNSDAVAEYFANWIGTQVLASVSRELGVHRFISTSTQYVHELSTVPMSPTDYSPFTAYGESKVMSERVTRGLLDGTATDYVIIRPTNVWGPRHPRYPNEFWRVLALGLYVHPRVEPPVRRAYGYVGTVTWQIRSLLDMNGDRFPSGQVLYVGDELIRLDDWVDAFAMALTGRRARRVNSSLIKLAGRIGDALGRVGVRAPLTTSRVNNMVGAAVAPMTPTTDLLGPSPWDLETGVAETVAWLRSHRT